jgi:hypothetical protein
MLQSITWRFPMLDYQVVLSEKLESDWVYAVDFIAQNVEQLSKLTITLDMCNRRDRHDMDYRNRGRRLVACDKVMLPLCKLKDLRDLRVLHSWDRNLRGNALPAEELRLERLAMWSGNNHQLESPLTRHQSESPLTHHRESKDFLTGCVTLNIPANPTHE